ncbi:MAG: hypothetical protein EOP49_23920 [Sphingobacteriales bacterium]|nr:MAG: hypothetical protein EOP49_23920 [Sphingobacteriales bacterium]
MMNSNYKMPFDPERLMAENNPAEMCSVAESIAQHLMLLITTRKRESRYDFEYGNDVWDIEFENAVTTVHWETMFVESMLRQITAYEPRIYDPKVEVHIVYVEQTYETRDHSEIKKKARIAVNAKLTDTGELFSFSTELFLSPMSID